MADDRPPAAGNKRAASASSDDASKKSKYHRNLKASHQHQHPELPRGEVPGLLVTCLTGKERQCARETITLLDECCPQNEGAAAAKPAEEKKSISARLTEELTSLRDEAKRQYRYHRVKGVGGMVFVEFLKSGGGDDGGDEAGTSRLSPTEAALAILNAGIAKRKCGSKFILRILPVETISFCGLEEIARAAKGVVARHFPADASAQTEGEETKTTKKPTFSVEYEHRANKKVDRLDVINAFAKLVPSPPFAVDLKQPDRTIIVQLAANKCFIGMAPGYRKYRKFNLQRVVEDALNAHETAAEAEAEEKE